MEGAYTCVLQLLADELKSGYDGPTGVTISEPVVWSWDGLHEGLRNVVPGHYHTSLVHLVTCVR